jgi:5'-deoxynucleotidase YfbR-like HD superfamily hydrolase
MKHLDQFPIANVGHAANVTRWHSANCMRYPSIAEHSYLVAMYARYLAFVIAPNMSPEDTLLMNDLCLVHDLPEVKTGDMATPLKRLLESMFPKGESPIDKIEEKICAPYADLRERTHGSYVAVIAKLADIMDAIKFIASEGKGSEAQRIQRERTLAFQDYVKLGLKGWPEHNWLEANKVLDDLLNGEPEPIDFREIIDSVKAQ